MTSPALATLATGTAGPRIAFLHGLFGQGRNWMQVAKELAGPDGADARCLLLDLPDHGRSPWSEQFSFTGYADAVAATLARAAGDEPWTVVGHSLGGKVAMTLALTHQDTVQRLAVVDIAPRSYGSLHRFTGYINAMRTMPLEQIERRGDAERHLASVESDPGVRAFLLQNLRRDTDNQGWRWQANLDLIAADAARGAGSRIADFPFDADDDVSFTGPVAWIRGEDSGYVQDGDSDLMSHFFPAARRISVKGATHWVHTTHPDVVVHTLRRLLTW